MLGLLPGPVLDIERRVLLDLSGGDFSTKFGLAGLLELHIRHLFKHTRCLLFFKLLAMRIGGVLAIERCDIFSSMFGLCLGDILELRGHRLLPMCSGNL